MACDVLPHGAMRLAFAAATFVTALCSVAAADPRFEVGAGIGMTQSQQDSTSNTGSQATENLFGRARLIGPLAVQAEVGATDVSGENVRSFTADAMAIFAFHQFHPYVLVGVGVDSVSGLNGTADQANSTVGRIEGGFGVEYRTRSGFAVGLELRDGTRNAPSPVVADPLPVAGGLSNNAVARFVPEQGAYGAGGDFRLLRVTFGIAF